jgi:hypothetical protein
MSAGDLTPARRVSSFDEITQAGDYCLSSVVYDGVSCPEVWFLLPTHKGVDKFDRPDEHSGLHGVSEPPWRFRECADGSLEIRESIGCCKADGSGHYWHGYLDEGNIWREV